MGKKKILLIVGIVLPILVVVAFVALGTHFFSTPLAFSISLGAPAAAAAPAAPPLPAPVHEAIPGTGILVDLGSKVVNLADPGGYRYLKVAVVLELQPTAAIVVAKAEERSEEEEKVRSALLERRALIDDSLISCLSNKTFGDIFSIEGKQQLRDEIAELINERIDSDSPVINVYFTDFVIN